MEVGECVYGFHYRLSRILKGYTVIWVIVYKLTKLAHFIPGKSTYTSKMPISLPSSRRDFRLPWASLICSGEICEQRLMGPELVQSTKETIQRIRTYKIFLKVVPMKGVLRFEKKGKLSPRFVGPFEILERVGPMPYRLALSLSLSVVHDVFHVSMLRKYVTYPPHVVDYKPLEIDEKLSYAKQLVEILTREPIITFYPSISISFALRAPFVEVQQSFSVRKSWLQRSSSTAHESYPSPAGFSCAASTCLASL
ncbi:pol protein [Cucumis melo var. makuwa]|uniref:Pol protein n=1 Tax=Cucumis melo var. makuwa TaxID=1194695 RepID=A0A5A7VRU3_CUCMM|nr:pol protein [Cucumis melo var. makuwa]